MIAYKLFRKRKDGTLGSLFICKKEILPFGVWLNAVPFPTKGFKFRPGWHCTFTPHAPHLSTKDRVWCRVEIEQFDEIPRPPAQGGLWYLAKRMKIISEL